jgi:hypothetical protein
MAAEMLSQVGHQVTLADAMPSVGRKFLMAGKSGLNLTKAAPMPAFRAAVDPCPPALTQALDAFGPDDVIAWAENLGEPVFTGSTGRVFPKTLKASPLLRAWIAKLAAQNVVLHTKWRWTGWDTRGTTVFETPDGQINMAPRVTVLALGGASWARLGSNGQWAQWITDTQPFAPANMGFQVDWSPHMTRHFGTPIKGIGLYVNGQRSRGECIISERGLEGGGIYAVSRAIREGAALTLDLLPDWPLTKLRAALAKPRGKASLSTYLRKTLRLDPVRFALLSEWGRPFPSDLAPLLKNLPVLHQGPRPLDEAISTAGGLRFSAMNDSLMLHSHPGVFCAGEMLDWEAPTGGYLITACLATGRLAGRAAANHLR